MERAAKNPRQEMLSVRKELGHSDIDSLLHSDMRSAFKKFTYGGLKSTELDWDTHQLEFRKMTEDFLYEGRKGHLYWPDNNNNDKHCWAYSRDKEQIKDRLMRLFYLSIQAFKYNAEQNKKRKKKNRNAAAEATNRPEPARVYSISSILGQEASANNSYTAETDSQRQTSPQLNNDNHHHSSSLIMGRPVMYLIAVHGNNYFTSSSWEPGISFEDMTLAGLEDVFSREGIQYFMFELRCESTSTKSGIVVPKGNKDFFRVMQNHFVDIVKCKDIAFCTIVININGSL
ncbi:hypothetical protein LX32DRAFT_645999 [Colletotrichum zoysiae]|uniref:Uncharacterized protein n=1 Tax=Colletotrichum zoysiae TaxID=1216348 RepID=A0AAD9H3X8_9PEZI|nr:hypothetical protein LX32DRAFT_645999 [Colletotrichum zoysiae]